MPFKARLIFPKSVLADPRAVVRSIENTLTGAALGVKVDFDVTTQTWKDRPLFVITRQPGKRLVATKSDIYRFISRGTRVRYAVMTGDFAAKTSPGVIGSSAGKGGLAFVGKKPLPGIKARKFEEVIGRKWSRLLPVLAQRAIDSEFKG